MFSFVNNMISVLTKELVCMFSGLSSSQAYPICTVRKSTYNIDLKSPFLGQMGAELVMGKPQQDAHVSLCSKNNRNSCGNIRHL